jgi:hypothetical protein
VPVVGLRCCRSTYEHLAGAPYPFFSSDLNSFGIASGAFVPPPGPDSLIVSINGIPTYTSAISGVGTVISSPPGISCPGTCAAAFSPGTKVTLHEVADPGSVVNTSYENAGAGCTPEGGQGGLYASQSCTFTVNGDTFANAEFTGFSPSLAVPFGLDDPANTRLVDVPLNGCSSSGVTSFQFSANGSSLGPPSGTCQILTPLSLGRHTVSLRAANTDGKRTATVTDTVLVTSVASFAWKIDPIAYGSDPSTTDTKVHFDACGSAGYVKLQWDIRGSGIPDKLTTDCEYTVSLPVGHTFRTTLTAIAPDGKRIVTSADVTVNAVFSAPGDCKTFAVGPDACWRHAFDWFGNAFGFSGNAMRPPDYAILAVNVGGVVANMAVTCDGNIYYGGGLSVGVGTDFFVSGVLGYGYVGGDPTTTAPSLGDIDSFVSGENDVGALSGFGAGVATVHSPNASGPKNGIEYFGGFTGPSLSLTVSYAVPGFNNQNPTPGQVCVGGVTASSAFQALMNQPVQSGAGLPSYDPLSGSSPATGQGAQIYVDTPSDTFSPGTDVTVAVHSTPAVIGTVASNSKGRLGSRLRLPSSLAPGVHRLLLTGVTPDGRTTKTLTMTLTVRSRLAGHGYWLVNSHGAVASFGKAAPHGGISQTAHSPSIVGIAATADARGYWLVSSAGRVFPYGDAHRYAATKPHLPSGAHIVAIASTPDGHGYWLVGSSGGVYSFGDAHAYRPASKPHLPAGAHIVAITTTPDGHGYWLTSSAGAVYAFGDARVHPLAPKSHVSGHVVSISGTPDGRGYWLANSGGGVFALGDARLYQRTSRSQVTARVVAISATPDGRGYWLATASGVVVSFGDAGQFSASGKVGPGPGTVGIADL